jgi:predicted DsbA family dithiol-disulfide isomerase
VLAEWMSDRFGASVEWLPFDLHPEYPPEGISREELVARYTPAGIERTAGFFHQHGLEYNPNPDVVPNSMKALRLTEHARAQGLHQPFHDRLMAAYWAEAQDIGDPDVLRALAAEVGLDGADEVLATGAHADAVQQATAQAHSIGISAIPAFLLDRRLVVLGAHPKSTFEQAFAQLEENAGEEAQPPAPSGR